MIQKKIGRPVQFEITEQTLTLSASGWPPSMPAGVETCSRAVLSKRRISRHDSMPASSIDGCSAPGLDSSACDTQFVAPNEGKSIDRKTGDLRAVQVLLGHAKVESTVHYLGIEVDDALAISEQVEL